MDFKRIKTVMIVILLVINAFFVYNLFLEYRDKYYIDESVLEDAVDILSRSGIKIGIEQIPEKRFIEPVYEGHFGVDHNERVAELISGSKIESAYSIPSGMRFVLTNGATVEISNDYDIVFFSPEADRYTAFSSIIENSFDDLRNTDEPEFSYELKDRLCFTGSSENGYITLGASFDSMFFDELSGCYILRYSQTLNSHRLFGHDLYCVYFQEELVYMEGDWTFLNADKRYSSQLYDQVNILFMEKKAVDGQKPEADLPNGSESAPLEIVGLDEVYCTYFNDDRSGLYFIPAWCITYADRSESVYDAYSGMQYVEK